MGVKEFSNNVIMWSLFIEMVANVYHISVTFILGGVSPAPSEESYMK